MQLSANGLAIEVEDEGAPDGAPLLLVMGLGMQLTSWPDELVGLLVARGLRVIRFDNRDAGLSQGFDELGVPNVPVAALRRMMRLPIRAPYTLRDMAADTLGVLDALGIARAHVCGASLGGMVAQHLAAEHSGRVASLTLMMTTSGSRRLPQPTPKAQLALMSRPAGRTRDALVEHMVRVLSVIGSPGALRADPRELRARVAAGIARAYRPAGTARQLLAVAADGDRTPLLARIEAPTHVIHGVADPLVPVENGRDLAARIRGATHDFIEGMGHDLPAPLFERFADGIATNARRAGARRGA
jgi:pimeloyl-ACP methyl ester carboxylesterase